MSKVPGTGTTVPGMPLVMGSTTPSVIEALVPTASQKVTLGHAIPRRSLVPATATAGPGMPLVMRTTTPLEPGESPTASQVVAVGQATDMSSPVRGTEWEVVADAGVASAAFNVTIPTIKSTRL